MAVGHVGVELDLNLGADLVPACVDHHDIPGHKIATDGDVVLARFSTTLGDGRLQRVPLVEGLHLDPFQPTTGRIADRAENVAAILITGICCWRTGQPELIRRRGHGRWRLSW